MMRPAIPGIAPCFIVRNVPAATSSYRDMLGFDIIHQQPGDDPFFAIVCRDEAMLIVKAVGEEPLPYHKRSNPSVALRWDAYVRVPDPDALAAEFTLRGVTFSVPLKDTHDGLRGFEIEDADGYLLFFGRPREN